MGKREQAGEADSLQNTSLHRILTIWLVVVGVLTVLVVGFLITFYFVSKTLDGIAAPGLNSKVQLENVLPAELITGDQLAWRELEFFDESERVGSYRLPGRYLSPTVLDLDSDGADELLVYVNSGGSWIVELDGSMEPFDLALAKSPEPLNWDYNLDGTPDLILSEVGSISTYLSIVDLQAVELARFDLAGLSLCSTTADLNGDGNDDLAVSQYLADGSRHLLLLSPHGETLPSPPEKTFFPCFGDTDGDGAAEVIELKNYSGEGFTAYHIDGSMTSFPGWEGDYLPSGCADLNGDGIDEIFAASHGYLNLVTGDFIPFDSPFNHNPGVTGYDEDVLVMDIDRDGVIELCTRGSTDGPDSAILCYDLQGNCLYYEELGTYIEDIFMAEDAAGEGYLVVQTLEQLLIYP